jgi:cell division protease FtsH
MIWKEYGEPTGMEELESDRRAIAIHEAGHAVAAHYLRRDYFNIRFGSIERRGRTGGMIASAAVADRQFKDRIAMINDIAVSLASGVAEGMFYEATSSGNGGDIGNATQTATYMVKAVGMGPTLQRYGDSEFTKGEFSDEVEAILIEGELIAIETLGDRRDQVEAIADLLVEEHTVAGSRIHALLEEMEG